MASNRVDRALRDVSSLGPTVAAIRIDRYRVGHYHLRDGLIVFDLVSAGAKVERIYRWAAAGHIGEIGSNVPQCFHFHAKDFPVIAEGNFDVLGVSSTVMGRLMAFRARFPPFDRNPKGARQEWTEQFFRI